jgi:glycerol-3-phosphate acyltransferase PlsX
LSPKIAVDAMGGDHAPAAPVEGAVRAVRERGARVVLVGDDSAVRAELRRLSADSLEGLEVRHASEVIEMADAPAHAVRRKKDASLRVGFDLVKSGECAAVLSAGNSGAMLAAGLFVLGRIDHVERPAILTPFPTARGWAALLDAGANTDPRPLHLVQWALMGRLYAQRVLGIDDPRVGLLSNGTEEGKGTDLTRAAHDALRKAPLHFLGYVEGRDIFTGEVDVLVTDGFTGNVLLKTAEGAATAIASWMREEAWAGIGGMLGALLMRDAFRRLRARIDYAEHGGAPLLGCKGAVVIAHGSSSAVAMMNAVRAAEACAGHDLEEEISRVCDGSEKLL